MLEKTKYILAESELKQAEEDITKQKQMKAQMRLFNEEKKADLIKIKLNRSKQ